MRPVEPVDLVAVGDVMVDVAVAGSGHGGAIRIRAGGSSANVAAWAAAAGARSAVVGRVGDDLPGRLVRAALEERGVRALLAVDRDAPTGCVVTLGDEGGPRVVADRGATARLAPDDVPAELRAEAVVVSGYALFRPGSADAARAALARSRAEWTAVDVAGLADAGSLPAATVLLANEEAGRALTGRGPVEAVRELGRRFRLACVTRGAAGAIASLDGQVATAPAPPVDVVDPVGAGDAFAAGLLVSLAGGASLEAALEAGCRLGALAASSPDPWPP
jgi:sugar/nucleoside kinase (ribokinase family)